MERLHGIVGSMFSGKSETLIKAVREQEIIGRKVLLYKPNIDNRWSAESSAKSHSGMEFPATPIPTDISLEDFFDQFPDDTSVVGFEEIQFFSPTIVQIVKKLLEDDVKVYFAGLPLDFRGETFGSMPELMALSDSIKRKPARCLHKNTKGKVCGKKATRTQRLVDGAPANYTDPIIMIGAADSYEARCPNHHIVPGKPYPGKK